MTAPITQAPAAEPAEPALAAKPRRRMFRRNPWGHPWFL
jgi:hypothetical protein